MTRAERLALCLERLRADLDDLARIVDVERVKTGEREELLVAAARIEGSCHLLSPAGLVELALLFLASGDYARARRHAEEAAAPGRAEPEVEARAHALLGRLAEVAGNRGDALAHYRLAHEEDPRSWRHQLDLAAILVEIGDPAGYDEAGDALSAAAALAGETDGIAFVRAQLMLRTGHLEDARRTLVGLVHGGADRYAAMAAGLLAGLKKGAE